MPLPVNNDGLDMRYGWTVENDPRWPISPIGREFHVERLAIPGKTKFQVHNSKEGRHPIKQRRRTSGNPGKRAQAKQVKLTGDDPVVDYCLSNGPGGEGDHKKGAVHRISMLAVDVGLR